MEHGEEFAGWLMNCAQNGRSLFRCKTQKYLDELLCTICIYFDDERLNDIAFHFGHIDMRITHLTQLSARQQTAKRDWSIVRQQMTVAFFHRPIWFSLSLYRRYVCDSNPIDSLSTMSISLMHSSLDARFACPA